MTGSKISSGGVYPLNTRASIRTRFVGPTNNRGDRIAVTDDGAFGEDRRRCVVGWDYALNTTHNHIAAAQAWLDQHNPGTQVVTPGLSFDGDHHWTWESASHNKPEEK